MINGNKTYIGLVAAFLLYVAVDLGWVTPEQATIPAGIIACFTAVIVSQQVLIEVFVYALEHAISKVNVSPEGGASKPGKL